MTFSRFLPLLFLAAVGSLGSAFVVPSSNNFKPSSTSLNVLNFMETFRQEPANRRDPYRQDYPERGDYYNDNSRYNDNSFDRQRDAYRNRMYSPRNDVYQRRTEVVNGQPTYNNNHYRQPPQQQHRSIVNPRNDVYAPRQSDNYYQNPRQTDYAADSLVDRELAKIRAKGRYAIENELLNTFGMSFPDYLTHEELSCQLLKARLRHQDGGNQQHQRGNWYSSNQRVRSSNNYNNNNKSNSAGSWVDGTSNMWSDNFWRN